jgi:hypothetical protein
MAGSPVPSGQAEAALRELVDRGALSPGQAAEVRAALARAAPAGGGGRWWAEVAGYLGGALLLGGGLLLVGAIWDELADPVRAALLGLLALGLAAAGLAIGRGPRELPRLRTGVPPARRRVVGVLFALAAVAAAGAAGVLGGDHGGVAAGAAGLLLAGAGYASLPTVPGLLTAAAASLVLVLSSLDELGTDSALGSGLALLALGALWLALAATGGLPHRGVGLGTGAVLALVGAQLPVGQSGAEGWAYALTFGVALACFGLYRWRRELVLLVAGVVGVAVAAPEAVYDWTGGAAGGAVVLLVAGAALVGASAVGLGLWRTHPARPAG